MTRRKRKNRVPKDDSCGEAIVVLAILAGGWLHMVATSVGWTT